MKFEWDEAKNQTNRCKHGLDFAEARRVFTPSLFVDIDDRADDGEARYVGLGLLDGRVVVVIFTQPDEETIRVISLRKATSYEREQYSEYLEN
jgi:uncharacterized protein